MALEVSSDVIGALLAEAAKAHPRECCGILLGSSEAISGALPTANVHPSSETRFEIDPAALIAAHRAARSGGPPVIGYYHSHPTGAAVPSATDSAMASRDGAIWAIIAAGGVRLWRAGLAGFEPLPYVVRSR